MVVCLITLISLTNGVAASDGDLCAQALPTERWGRAEWIDGEAAWNSIAANQTFTFLLDSFMLEVPVVEASTNVTFVARTDIGENRTTLADHGLRWFEGRDNRTATTVILTGNETEMFGTIFSPAFVFSLRPTSLVAPNEKGERCHFSLLETDGRIVPEFLDGHGVTDLLGAQQASSTPVCLPPSAGCVMEILGKPLNSQCDPTCDFEFTGYGDAPYCNAKTSAGFGPAMFHQYARMRKYFSESGTVVVFKNSVLICYYDLTTQQGTDGPADYSGISTTAGQLAAFAAAFPRQSYTEVRHLFSGREYDYLGWAVCRNHEAVTAQLAYEGSFTDAAESTLYQSFALTHETGHLFDASHHDNPPDGECANGQPHGDEMWPVVQQPPCNEANAAGSDGILALVERLSDPASLLQPFCSTMMGPGSDSVRTPLWSDGQRNINPTRNNVEVINAEALRKASCTGC